MTESDAENVDLSTLRIDRSKRNRSSRRRKKWLHLLWLFLPVALYFTYQLTIKEVTPAAKVRVAQVSLVTGSEAVAELVATGYVVAQIKAAVASKATGRLKILNVEEGDQVLAGDVLGVLENDDISANLDIVRANLKSARAESTVAVLDFHRQSNLRESGLISDDILEAATARYYMAAAAVEGAIAHVRAAEVALENTYIEAPFDGTVLTKNADVGEIVAPLASSSSSRGAIVTMADMSSLEVEADVSESNIYKVKVGAPTEIILDAYPQVKYPGYVKRIIPTADRSRATVLTRIAFDEFDDRVLPEMSARVNFLTQPDEQAVDQEAVLAVPRSAITTRAGRKVLFLLAGKYVREVPVEVGRELGAVTEILSGASEGDRVILSPAGSMESGDKVEVSQ